VQRPGVRTAPIVSVALASAPTARVSPPTSVAPFQRAVTVQRRTPLAAPGYSCAGNPPPHALGSFSRPANANASMTASPTSPPPREPPSPPPRSPAEGASPQQLLAPLVLLAAQAPSSLSATVTPADMAPRFSLAQPVDSGVASRSALPPAAAAALSSALSALGAPTLTLDSGSASRSALPSAAVAALSSAPSALGVLTPTLGGSSLPASAHAVPVPLGRSAVPALVATCASVLPILSRPHVAPPSVSATSIVGSAGGLPAGPVAAGAGLGTSSGEVDVSSPELGLLRARSGQGIRKRPRAEHTGADDTDVEDADAGMNGGGGGSDALARPSLVARTSTVQASPHPLPPPARVPDYADAGPVDPARADDMAACVRLMVADPAHLGSVGLSPPELRFETEVRGVGGDAVAWEQVPTERAAAIAGFLARLSAAPVGGADACDPRHEDRTHSLRALPVAPGTPCSFALENPHAPSVCAPVPRSVLLLSLQTTSAASDRPTVAVANVVRRAAPTDGPLQSPRAASSASAPLPRPWTLEVDGLGPLAAKLRLPQTRDRLDLLRLQPGVNYDDLLSNDDAWGSPAAPKESKGERKGEGERERVFRPLLGPAIKARMAETGRYAIGPDSPEPRRAAAARLVTHLFLGTLDVRDAAADAHLWVRPAVAVDSLEIVVNHLADIAFTELVRSNARTRPACQERFRFYGGTFAKVERMTGLSPREIESTILREELWSTASDAHTHTVLHGPTRQRRMLLLRTLLDGDAVLAALPLFVITYHTL
jgi:hypothetical protein